MAYNEDTRNVIDEFKSLPVCEIKKRIKRNTFSIATLNIQYNINIGTMIRTCNAFGGREFIIIGKKQWDRRGSVGTHNYETMIYLKDGKELEEWLKVNKRTPIAVDYLKGSSIPTTLIDKYPPNPLFIFGSESNGLSSDIINLCHLKIHVEQFGSVKSLNVGIAAGIVMYDWRTKHLPKDVVL